jgi:YVTN family beta-propeller protein
MASFVTIPVGIRPHFVAASLTGDRLYVTNWGSETVSVIDANTLMVIRSPITFGDSPAGVAVTPNGARVYVANNYSDNVSVIDTATNAVITKITVGNHPDGVAVTSAGGAVYVANLFSDSVSVINTATNAVVATIPIPPQPSPMGPLQPGSRFVAIAGTAIRLIGGRAYVTNYFSGSVSVIDTVTNTVIFPTIAVGRSPTGVAVAPNGRRAYVANTNSDSVSVIDTTTNPPAVVGPAIDVGPGPEGVAVDPGGDHLFVTDTAQMRQDEPDANTVSVIDTQSNAVVTTLPPVGEFPLGLVATATNVYVAHEFSDIVSVIDI